MKLSWYSLGQTFNYRITNRLFVCVLWGNNGLQNNELPTVLLPVFIFYLFASFIIHRIFWIILQNFNICYSLDRMICIFLKLVRIICKKIYLNLYWVFKYFCFFYFRLGVLRQCKRKKDHWMMLGGHCLI